MIWNERIKQLRAEYKYTLKDVAKKLGVQEATAQRYESGEIKNIPYGAIVAYSEMFSCSPSYIMGWSEDHSFIQSKEDDLALLVNQLIHDRATSDALKIYYTLSPEKRKHVVETIHLLAGSLSTAPDENASNGDSSAETARSSE